jgi:type II restriction/modification system DNA methylase subunit YeeA
MTTLEDAALEYIISVSVSKKASIGLLYAFYLDSFGVIDINHITFSNLFKHIRNSFDDVYPSKGYSNTLEDFIDLNIDSNDTDVFSESLETLDINPKDYRSINWKLVNTELFGSVYETVTDRDTKRSGGIFYTSKNNILKLIKPLFLDDLWNEFEECKSSSKELEKFHNKLSQLKFLDPACGCGNFLITTFKELFKLESEILKLNPVLQRKVSIDQMHGIEIEPVAAQASVLALSVTKYQSIYEVL